MLLERVIGTRGVGIGHEEAVDETVESISWRPRQCHTVDVFLAVDGLCFTVFVGEPFENFTEDGVGACNANAFVGEFRMGWQKIEERVDKGSVHVLNIFVTLDFEGMRYFAILSFVAAVSAREVGGVGWSRWVGIHSNRVRFGGVVCVHRRGHRNIQQVHVG